MSNQYGYMELIMRNEYKLVFIIMLCISLAGCNSIFQNKDTHQAGKESSISILLNNEYKTVVMNKNLHLRFFEIKPKIVNDFRIGSHINLALKSSSTESIRFFSQEGIAIYKFEGGQYIQIDDVIGRDMDEPIFLLPDFELPFSVIPKIQSNNSVEILIVVTGTIMDDGKLTNNKVGTYIECTLEP